MGKLTVKGRNITPRHTFPIRESMSTDSVIRLADMRDSLADKATRNASAIRGMHK